MVCKRCGHSFTHDPRPTLARARRARAIAPTPARATTVTANPSAAWSTSPATRSTPSCCRRSNASCWATTPRPGAGHRRLREGGAGPQGGDEATAKADDRELELLNRKIKATIAMLADPTFDGLDELRTTLADLKTKRDTLEATPQARRRTPRRQRSPRRNCGPGHSSSSPASTTWPRAPTIDLQDRQMVEAFVDRIEIDPDAKTGVVFIADLADAFREGSARKPSGDFMGTTERTSWGHPVGRTISQRHAVTGQRAAVPRWIRWRRIPAHVPARYEMRQLRRFGQLPTAVERVLRISKRVVRTRHDD